LKNNSIIPTPTSASLEMLFFYQKLLKMKKLFAIVLLVIALGATLTSCTASRGGCKATAGMAGYR